MAKCPDLWALARLRGRSPGSAGARLARGRFRRLGVQTGLPWTKRTIGSANPAPGWTFSTIGRSKWTFQTIGRQKTSPNRSKRPRGPPKDTQSCKTSTSGQYIAGVIAGFVRYPRRVHMITVRAAIIIIAHHPPRWVIKVVLVQRSRWCPS